MLPDETLAQAGRLLERLQARGLTLATAESCTGGLIAAQLTEVPGASEVFGFGYVTYWETAKTKLLGVDASVIEAYDVVSAPVAAQMALGAKLASGADIAVGITGLAGPDGGDAARPVGTVYLAVAMEKTVWVQRLSFANTGRQEIRLRAARAALEMLRRAVLELAMPGSALGAAQVKKADFTAL